MPRKFNADILGRLGEATAADLSAALTAIGEDARHFASQPASQEAVEALETLHDAATQIKDQLAARRAPDAALNDRAAERAAAIAALTDSGTDDAGQADDDNRPESEREPAERGAPADQPGIEVQEAVNEQAGQEARPAETEGGAVTASARRPLGTAGYRPPAAPARVLPRVLQRTFANSGVPHTPTGDPVDREAVWASFANIARQVRNGTGYQRYPLITVTSEYPEDRHLRRGVTASQNMEKVDAVVADARLLHARDNLAQPVRVRAGADGRGALTAAGFCAPVETLYDIRVIGDQDRPVRDALVRFGADRGGVQYRPAMNGVSQTLATGVWTATNDEADPLVPKTCVEIDCPGITTAEVEALYQCLTFSNMSTRFDPEFYDAVIRSQAIAHARFAENRLLTALTTASKDVYSTQVLGATRDILVTLDQMTAYYRSVHRLAGETALRLILPMWARNLMRADITRQMVGDGMQALAVTDAMLNGWLAERNVNITWHLDGIDPADLTGPTPDVVVPAQAYTVLADEAAVPGFPNAISSILFAEGDWLYLDGGTLDLGVVRDSTLNSENRFQTFSEEFAMPAFRGIESIHLVMQVNPTGQSAATKDTSAIAD